MNKLFNHPLIILLFTILTSLFILSLRRTAQKSQTATENVTLLENQIDQLSDQIESEQQTIKYAASDLAKEKILRNELLLQKQGEIVLQIPDDETLTIEAEAAEQKTPWQEWKELLF